MTDPVKDITQLLTVIQTPQLLILANLIREEVLKRVPTACDPIPHEERKEIMKECYVCSFMERVPGNCHIKCNNPDPQMVGSPHGIKHGWFYYPYLFDPTWKLKKCSTYEHMKPFPEVTDD